MWRPQATAWVEMLAERADAARLLEVLADSATIELQRTTVHEIPFALVDDADGRAALSRVVRLRARCSDVLPAPRRPQQVPRVSDLGALADTLENWEVAAQAPVRELRELNNELDELAVLASCLELLPVDQLRLDQFHVPAGAQWHYVPWIATGHAALDAVRLATGQEGVVAGYDEGEHGKRLVVAGVIEQPALEDFERRMHGLGMRFARIPPGLPRRNLDARRAIREREAAYASRRAQVRTQLDQLDRQYDVAGSLWLCDRQVWLNSALESGWCGERFVIVSGWIPRDRVEEIRGLLSATGVPYLLRVESGVAHGPAPVVLRNPAWARRFEVFVRAFGTPGADEIDPSPLLAWVMPLMFGYMFGDVGQGALLVLVGVLTRRRWPVLGLFVPAGISAMVFGVLYGSVFSIEHLIPALWMPPLEDPLTILAVPLVLGALLLSAGLLFAALHAAWSGRFRGWVEESSAVVLVYAGALTAIAAPAVGGWIVMAALVWAFVVAAAGARHAGESIARALGLQAAHLLEECMQLAMNTLSFVRVGAFALAHGGLSLAVVALADMSEGMAGKLLVLVVGNVFVTVLEGMIVSIQTTRLVLFEFFRRFLQAGGRPFRPLTLPDSPPARPWPDSQGDHP